jgi:hypothetical protein
VLAAAAPPEAVEERPPPVAVMLSLDIMLERRLLKLAAA